MYVLKPWLVLAHGIGTNTVATADTAQKAIVYLI